MSSSLRRRGVCLPSYLYVPPVQVLEHQTIGGGLQAATCSLQFECRQIASASCLRLVLYTMYYLGTHSHRRPDASPSESGRNRRANQVGPAATRRPSWTCRGKRALAALRNQEIQPEPAAPRLYPPPIEKASPGSASVGEAGQKLQGRYQFGTPCAAPAGMALLVLSPYPVRAHASPGISRSRLITKPGACDCSVDCLQPPASRLCPLPIFHLPLRLASLYLSSISLSLSLLSLTIASPPSLFSIPTPSIVPSSRLPSPTPGLCAICLFRSPSSCRSLISPSYTLGPCRSPS